MWDRGKRTSERLIYSIGYLRYWTQALDILYLVEFTPPNAPYLATNYLSEL